MIPNESNEELKTDLTEQEEIKIEQLNIKYNELIADFAKPLPPPEKRKPLKFPCNKEINVGRYRKIVAFIDDDRKVMISNAIYNCRVKGFIAQSEKDNKYDVFVHDDDGVEVLNGKGRSILKSKTLYEDLGFLVESHVNISTNSRFPVTITLYME